MLYCIQDIKKTETYCNKDLRKNDFIPHRLSLLLDFMSDAFCENIFTKLKCAWMWMANQDKYSETLIYATTSSSINFPCCVQWLASKSNVFSGVVCVGQLFFNFLLGMVHLYVCPSASRELNARWKLGRSGLWVQVFVITYLTTGVARLIL